MIVRCEDIPLLSEEEIDAYYAKINTIFADVDDEVKDFWNDQTVGAGNPLPAQRELVQPVNT